MISVFIDKILTNAGIFQTYQLKKKSISLCRFVFLAIFYSFAFVMSFILFISYEDPVRISCVTFQFHVVYIHFFKSYFIEAFHFSKIASFSNLIIERFTFATALPVSFWQSFLIVPPICYVLRGFKKVKRGNL